MTSVIKAVIFLAFIFFPFIRNLGQDRLTVIGVNQIGHTTEASMKFSEPHGSDLSARYQLFVRNDSRHPVTVEKIKKLRINNRLPGEWHTEGKLSWYRFPEQDPRFPDEIPDNAMMVWEFNGRNHEWLDPSGIMLRTGGMDTLLKNEDQRVYIAYAVFTGEEACLDPTLATIHVFNDSKEDLQVRDVICWQPAKQGPWQFLYPSERLIPTISMSKGRMLKAGEKSMLQIRNETFRLGQVAIQVGLENMKGQRKEIWAYLKIKKEKFDISAGWSNDPIGGKPGFLNEYFLKTLRSLYINTAHYTGQPGFSDNDPLFAKYPIKFFGHLLPWERYDRDSLLPRIHGIEFLGEPQYGGGKPVDPQKVNTELLPFAASRIPTTLTHSEERIWRFYAGLSDYPHFDAYRVSAPSADKWEDYDRWNGKRIGWGAPLETIGAMTRSLKHLNRPAPIAYWSQGPHEGWEVYDGRERTSPTPSELRVQAYHALSTGITSLYWFNLSYGSLVKYPDLLEPMQRIGREIRLLDRFYIHGCQWNHEKMGTDTDPLWDLSTFVAPQGILLFALDLDYAIDTATKTFVFRPNRKAVLTFKLPGGVDGNWALMRIGKDGPVTIPYTRKPEGRIEIRDDITEVGIYALLPSTSACIQLKEKWQGLIDRESTWDADPVKNVSDRGKLIGLGK